MQNFRFILSYIAESFLLLFASEVEDLSFSLLRYGRGEHGCLHQQNRKNLRHDRLERRKEEEKKSETIWLVVKDLQVRVETNFGRKDFFVVL